MCIYIIYVSTCTYVLVRIIHGEYKEIVFPSIQFSILGAREPKGFKESVRYEAESRNRIGFRV